MTTETELLELAERLEKATGADDATDWAIAEAVGCAPGLAYTASLDAAMTLVPEGAKAATVNWCPYGSGVAEVYLGNPGPMFGTEAATPAIALCAAALRARATTQTPEKR
jgi:hypothetical protein